MDGIIIQQDAVYKTEKGTPVTDSLKVAQVFNKQHKNIMQAIRNILGSAENSAHRKWFCESRYCDTQGKQQPMFLMTRDGFSLLAMGLTSRKHYALQRHRRNKSSGNKSRLKPMRPVSYSHKRLKPRNNPCLSANLPR